MSRFVRPDERTLTISKGDTLTVRRRLTAGERRDAYGRMYQTGPDGQLTRHPVLYGLHMVSAYLIDWSLTDDSGKKVAIRDLSPDQLVSVLNNLSHEDFIEIRDAIDAHEAEMVAERADAKKTPDGETNSVATSPSPSAAAGASSGSVS